MAAIMPPPPFVKDLPHFRRPMPVDRKRHPQMPERAMAAGRAHVAIMEHRRGDWDVLSYERSEWALLTQHFRKIMMRAAFHNGSSTPQISIQDTGNVERFMAPWGTATNTLSFINGQGTTNDQCFLRYGTGTTAPAVSDYGLTWAGAGDIAATVAYDESDWLVTLSGSEVAGSNVTVGEVGALVRWLSTGSSTRYDILADRSTVGPTAVTAGQTIAISYEFQF